MKRLPDYKNHGKTCISLSKEVMEEVRKIKGGIALPAINIEEVERIAKEMDRIEPQTNVHTGELTECNKVLSKIRYILRFINDRRGTRVKRRRKFNKALGEMESKGIYINRMGIAVKHKGKEIQVFCGCRWLPYAQENQSWQEFIVSHINLVYESIGECKRDQWDHDQKCRAREKAGIMNAFNDWVRCKVARRQQR